MKPIALVSAYAVADWSARISDGAAARAARRRVDGTCSAGRSRCSRAARRASQRASPRACAVSSSTMAVRSTFSTVSQRASSKLSAEEDDAPRRRSTADARRAAHQPSSRDAPASASSKPAKSPASSRSSGRRRRRPARSQRASARLAERAPRPRRVIVSRISTSGRWLDLPGDRATARRGRRPRAPRRRSARDRRGRQARRRCSAATRSEELVLAAEHLAHRAVGEDPADRVGEQLRAGQHVDVVGRARRAAGSCRSRRSARTAVRARFS